MNLDYDKGNGLIPVVVQHFATGEVLMVGYGNAESMRKCQETGELWLYSRSRAQLWHKGETSGNTQRVASITPDCDGDAVLIRVEPRGPMCHTGTRACFDAAPTLVGLADVITQRRAEPPATSQSYTSKLLEDENLRLKKIGEEAAETLIAAKGGNREQIVHEVADLWFHTLVLLAAQGLKPDDILQELARRFGTSGLVEKAGRPAK